MELAICVKNGMPWDVAYGAPLDSSEWSTEYFRAFRRAYVLFCCRQEGASIDWSTGSAYTPKRPSQPR